MPFLAFITISSGEGVSKACAGAWIASSGNGIDGLAVVACRRMPANGEGRAAAASGCIALTVVVVDEAKSGADGSVSSKGFGVLCRIGVMGLRVRPPLAIFC